MSRPRPLHIVQAGIDNGDKAWLEKAAGRGLRSTPNWVVPKFAKPGDDVVLYIGGYGFFATAHVASTPRPRRDWPNRYGAALERIRLVTPAISLATIQRHVPELAWATYPRSITTPSERVAEAVAALIRDRRRTGMPDLSEEALEAANMDELRRVALLKAVASAPARTASRLYRARSLAIRLYVLRRAGGKCEGCHAEAPFVRADGSPYLEPHHVTRLADDGPDHPGKVNGLCPHCHSRAHHGADATVFGRKLKTRLRILERGSTV